MKVALLVASSAMVAQVHAHGYMSIPTPRSTDTFSDMTNTGACDRSQVGKVTEFKAGEEITVEWTRNNHLGGFIRYSMVPRNQANKAAFDKGTFFYTCRETNCTLKQCKDKWCGDDAGSKDHQIKCSSKVKLPDYLQAGDYVLQWTWHSAGSSYGNVGWNTGNYKTCADIRLTTSGTGTKPSCPTFVGGDRVTKMENKPADQCFYFEQNDLDTKEIKIGTGWNNKEGMSHYKYGKPKEIEKCGGGAAPAAGQGPAPVPATGANNTAPSAGGSKPSTGATPVPATSSSPSWSPKPSSGGGRPPASSTPSWSQKPSNGGWSTPAPWTGENEGPGKVKPPVEEGEGDAAQRPRRKHQKWGGEEN
ncbi:hypothetical protein Poli38472_012630 [Pythium oligandrum]|uniref:Auxiliary Activity family 9 catalytic domain-containing protein n=1 Tax=Pythium oligandrum TaxID=41045 RepID=A0A8K1FHW1_PYTOL|nr:hypothetical protein Poli38472_012630 [Pythium oligandrum]|eukprot:TMW61439.1 hypothetical protein Poli38472_012630 [Pythium oligandrum]